MEDVEITNEQQCKNCGSVLDGKFCKNCGQKVIEHKETIWHAVTHFVSDIFHYDGRFIRTLKLLLTRPGFLSLEYKNGAREKYVDPFRLYLFMSALAVVVFVNIESPQETVTRRDNPDIIRFIDSTRAALLTDRAHSAKNKKGRYDRIKFEVNGKKITILDPADILKHGKRYYDSVQNTLSPQKRTSGYFRYKDMKVIEAYDAFDMAPYNYSQKIDEKISLLLPKAFFISMPFFILALFALYFNKRKQYLSAYHAIFTLHIYTTMWVFIMLDSITSTYFEHPKTHIIYTCVGYIIFFGCLVYLYVAMLRFYKERWWLTLIKAIVLIIFTGLVFYGGVLILKEYLTISLATIPA
ncbi:MAG: DUF3667 domain-containing protein [Bacteroidetes bacterium]|nr:DUF3667 domain-containing protein [Bacteroidota bacterium]